MRITLATAAVLAAALLSGPRGAGAQDGGPCAAPPAHGSTTIALTSDGIPRSAVLHLPAAPAGRALPLLVALHGYNGTGADFERDTGLSTLADRDGFAVVYPSSAGSAWHISGSTIDVQFVSDLLGRVEGSACVDTSRVYATGVSNGAGMAARLACDLSSQIAAAAPIAGGYRSLPACHPAQPVSVLEMHGTADTTVPYHGDGDDHAGAALAYAFGWAERDGCRPKPLKTHYAPHTIRYLWQGCAGGSVVEQLSLYDVGHGLPEAPAADIRAPGPQTIAGAQTAWSFLSAISRSPAL